MVGKHETLGFVQRWVYRRDLSGEMAYCCAVQMAAVVYCGSGPCIPCRYCENARDLHVRGGPCARGCLLVGATGGRSASILSTWSTSRGRVGLCSCWDISILMRRGRFFEKRRDWTVFVAALAISSAAAGVGDAWNLVKEVPCWSGAGAPFEVRRWLDVGSTGGFSNLTFLAAGAVRRRRLRVVGCRRRVSGCCALTVCWCAEGLWFSRDPRGCLELPFSAIVPVQCGSPRF